MNPALMALPLVGGLVSAYGAFQQGQMTSQTLNAQANLQMQQAQEAEEAGAVNAQRVQITSQQKIGSDIANYGAAGVDVNTSGSVASVIGSSAANAELDRLNVLHSADIKSINYQNQAAMDRYGAASAMTGAYWNALGDLTGGLIKGWGNTISSSPSSPVGTSSGSGSDVSGYSLPSLGSVTAPQTSYGLGTATNFEEGLGM